MRSSGYFFDHKNATRPVWKRLLSCMACLMLYSCGRKYLLKSVLFDVRWHESSMILFLAAFSLMCFTASNLSVRMLVGSAWLAIGILILWCIMTSWETKQPDHRWHMLSLEFLDNILSRLPAPTICWHIAERLSNIHWPLRRPPVDSEKTAIDTSAVWLRDEGLETGACLSWHSIYIAKLVLSVSIVFQILDCTSSVPLALRLDSIEFSITHYFFNLSTPILRTAYKSRIRIHISAC